MNIERREDRDMARGIDRRQLIVNTGSAVLGSIAAAGLPGASHAAATNSNCAA